MPNQFAGSYPWGKGTRCKNVGPSFLGSDPDPQGHAQLADRWWDLGERAKSTTYRQPCRERALHWYLQAYELLPDSLDRIHVKNRIEEAEAHEGETQLPYAVI